MSAPATVLEPLTMDRRPASLATVRERFPILARRIGEHRLVYLDTAATALKPAAVIEALAHHYQTHDGGAHRGIHTLASEATEAYEQGRARVARWLGVPFPDGVVVTRNATAALNLVARGSEHRLKAGDEVLLTEMEHHANLVPWLQLAARTGIVLRFIPITERGTLELASLPALLGARTRLVSLAHVSNVLGTINPVAEIAEAAHRVGALVLVDAAQSVGHMPVSLGELGADLLAFSAHKAYGPAGLGWLVGRPEILAELEPVESGGQMVSEVHFDRATWAELPWRLEAGTADVAAVAAFVPAMDLLDELGLGAVRRHELRLLDHAWRQLQALGGLRLLGPPEPAARGAALSFHDPRLHPHDLATVLDTQGVAVRAGHHCAQPLHRKLGLSATVRASFGVYSTLDDVEALVEGIRMARRLLS